MSLTGPDPDDPHARRGPDRRPARRHVRRVRRASPRCTSATRTGRGRVVRTCLLAAIVGVHAFQGTALHRGRRGARTPRATTTPRSPRTACSAAPTACSRSPCGSEGLWQKLAAAFGLDPDAPGMATNARAGRQPRRGDRRARRRRSPTARAADLLAALAEAGVPAGEVRTLDRVYDWDQTRSQGLVIDVDHPVLGRIELPGPAAPLRRQRARRRPRRAPAPAGARRARRRRSAPGSTRWTRGHGADSRGERQPAGSAPASCSTPCSTRARWPSLGRAARRDPAAPGSRLRRRAGRGRRPAPATTSRSSPARAAARAAGSPSSPASSRFLAGSIGVAAAERLVARGRAGHRARGCRCSPPRPPAAPGCRRARRPSCRWSRSPPPCAAHKAAGPALPRLPAPPHDRRGASPPGARSGTSPSPSRARWSGFLGPRVYEALYGEPFPEGVQTAENLYEHGLLDACCRSRRWRRWPTGRSTC